MKLKAITQLTEAELKAMWSAGKHKEIEQARVDGRLATVLGTDAPLDGEQILSVADVKKLYAEGRFADIDRARAENRINYDDTEGGN